MSPGLPVRWSQANYAFAAAMALTVSALLLPAIGLATGTWFLVDAPALSILITVLLAAVGSWIFGRWLLRTTALDTPSASYAKTRDTVLSSWLMVVIAWAAWTFYLDSAADPIQIGTTGTAYALLATVGVTAAIGSGLLLIALAHHRARLAEMVAEGVVVRAKLKRDLSHAVPWIIGAVVLFALVFPSDLSPFQISDINRWMERLTDAIGPAFVPRDNPAAKLRQTITFSPGRWMMQGSGAGQINPIWVFFQIVVFVLVAMWAVRVFRTRKTRRERSTVVGYVPWGFRWLWGEIKALIVRLISRFTRWATGQTKTETAVPVHGIRTPFRRRARTHPSTVEEWYALVLQRAARRGLIKHPAETPYEFLVRWRTWHALSSASTDESDPAPEEDSFRHLTEIVVQTRYSGRYAPSWLQRARHAAAGSLRQFARIRWRRKSRPTGREHLSS